MAQDQPTAPSPDGKPQVKVNYLNVCTPGKDEEAILKGALAAVQPKPAFSTDFELSRGRTSLKDAPDAKYVRLRRDFAAESPLLTAQYSMSTDATNTVEILVLRPRDPKDFLQVVMEDRTSASAAKPLSLLQVDTPTSRVRVERLNKSSRCLHAARMLTRALTSRCFIRRRKSWRNTARRWDCGRPSAQIWRGSTPMPRRQRRLPSGNRLRQSTETKLKVMNLMDAMENSVRDTVVLGTGCAGLTAAIYAGRANLNPLVIEGHEPGGQLSLTTLVENFPGFPEGIQGPELIENMRKQAARFGAEYMRGHLVKADLTQRPFNLDFGGGKTVITRTLIIASGASARWLGLPNEQKLIGHGVSSCATCDGFFFKGKPITVIGGGDPPWKKHCSSAALPLRSQLSIGVSISARPKSCWTARASMRRSSS